MVKDHLLTLMGYNYRANGLILKYVDLLKADQYYTKTAHSQESIYEIIHILFAEWV